MTDTNITTYPVLEAKNATEPTGYQLLPISRTDGKKGKSGLCIQVPVVSDSLATVIYNNEVGQAWFRAQVAKLQSELASAANKAGNAITSITIGIDSLIAAMQVQEAAARISKESIGTWFDTGMVPLLSAALTAKGLPEGTHAAIIANFRASFQRLAVSEVTMPTGESEQITKALGLIAEDSELAQDAMTEKLATRLDAAIERSNKLTGAL